MKIRHDGDCTIYSSLINGRPEEGICICGYGWQQARNGDRSEMYSQELQKMLEKGAGRAVSEEDITKLFNESEK